MHRLRRDDPHRIRGRPDDQRDDDLRLARIMRIKPHQRQCQRRQTQDGCHDRTVTEIPRPRRPFRLIHGHKEFIAKTTLQRFILDLFGAKRTFFHIARLPGFMNRFNVLPSSLHIIYCAAVPDPMNNGTWAAD